MKTIQEQIEVMQHFANGGEVMRRECGDRFVDVKTPVWDWSSCDYYIKPVDPYAELKAAANDPTKQIRCEGQGWFDCGAYSWKWDCPIEHYEIRDKPKTKKIKLLAWYGAVYNGLFWHGEEVCPGIDWQRVPELDKTVEVEQ